MERENAYRPLEIRDATEMRMFCEHVNNSNQAVNLNHVKTGHLKHIVFTMKSMKCYPKVKEVFHNPAASKSKSNKSLFEILKYKLY